MLFRRQHADRSAARGVRRKALTAAGIAVAALGLLAMLSSPASAQTESSTSIVNDNSGLCVSVPGASTAATTVINQYTCGGYPDQYWDLVQVAGNNNEMVSGNLYEIVNDHSGLCLSVPAASTKPTTVVNQYPCGGYPDQYWYVDGSTSEWEIINNNSNLCLSVPGASKAATTDLNQYTCGGYPDQYWDFSYQEPTTL